MSYCRDVGGVETIWGLYTLIVMNSCPHTITSPYLLLCGDLYNHLNSAICYQMVSTHKRECYDQQFVILVAWVNSWNVEECCMLRAIWSWISYIFPGALYLPPWDKYIHTHIIYALYKYSYLSSLYSMLWELCYMIHWTFVPWEFCIY